MVTVLIGGDICPIERNQIFFRQGDSAALFNDLLAEFQAADLVMANLECPLIEKPAPILKTGPNFGEPGDCVNGIRNAGIDILALANNHILDHGAAGVRNTLEVCSRAGISTVGAGENLAAARRILVEQRQGLRIAILAVAEHEFSIASENKPGANPLDLINIVRDIKANRADFDYLIVLLHGSAEFHVPTPRIQDLCRFLIEIGANSVIVQHPHCLGGYETYRDGHIVYGQGALIMDEKLYRDRPSFHEGFLVKLSITDTTSRMDLVPFVQSELAPGAKRMPAEREQEFRRELEGKAKAVTDPAHVQREWLKFCEKSRHRYLSGLLGHNRVFRKLNQSGLITRLAYGQRPLLGVRNIVSCETHREAIQTIFDQGLI